MDLRRLLSPPVFPDDDRTLLARQLWYMLFGLIGIFTIGPALLVAAMPDLLSRWLVLGIGMCTLYFATLALTRAGRPHLAAWFLIVVVLVVSTSMAATAGGIGSPAAMSFLVIVPLAAILLGKRASLFTSLASAAAAIGLLAFEHAGLLPEPHVRHNSTSICIVLVCLLAFFLLAHRAVARTVEQARRAVQESSARRRDADVAVRASKERLAAIYDAVSEAIFIHDAETGAILDVNRSACQISGYTREELVASATALLDAGPPPHSLADALRWMQRARAEGPQAFEWRTRTKSGKPIWLDNNLRRIVVDGAERILVTSRDITERKHAEEALRTSERRLSFALEAVNDGLYDLNLQTGEAYCSPRYFTMMGYRADELPSSVETWKSLLHPDALPQAQSEIQRYLTGGTEYHEFEVRMRARDGSWRWILSRGRLAERSADGLPLRLIGTHIDVTEQHNAREALREAEQRLRMVVEHSTNLFYLHTTDQLLHYVSPQCRTMFDCEPEEAMVEWTSFLTDNPVNAIGMERAMAAIESGKPQPPYELELRGLKGRVIWVEIHEAPVVKDGGTVAIAGSLTDITERKRTEAALRASEERYRMLFDAGNDAIFIGALRADGQPVKFTQVNDVACRMLGYSKEELLQLSPSDINAPETRDRTPEIIALLVRDQRALFEVQHLTKDGRSIPVEVNARVFDLGGERTVFSVVRDVTERKRLEEQLRHSQKMEIFGQLASGVAHDFNNLLVVINGNTELLLHDTALHGHTHEQLEQVFDAGRRAAALTKQLLLFGRKQKPHVTRADLAAIVGNHVKLLQRIIGEDINLALEFAPTPLPVRVDVNMLEQVVMNLAVNARDAMPGGGRLAIRTRRVGLDSATAVRCACEPGVYAALHVCDSGTGIPPEIQPLIFDPFFTTKDAGKGTGLGLSTVLTIVQQHGGGIDFTSERGRGTEFTVYLPLAFEEPQADDPRATSAAIAAVGRPATILLVEDEDSVRTTTARILRTKGLRVIETRSGTEGLARLQAATDMVDVVLSDIVMPGGIDGVQLAGKIAAQWPELPVILMTGYTRDIDNIDRPVLHKPFTIAVLFSALRTALERSHA